MVGNQVSAKKVLIVGGGASGLLVAIQIASKANSPLAVDIAEPSEFLGRGLAYGTSDASHVLNVPAGRMSIFPDISDHFSEWLKADENTFASRREYGRYLLESFVELQASRNNVVFEHKRFKVTDLAPDGHSWKAYSEDKDLGKYDFVVLAIGHGKPIQLKALDAITGHHRYSADPWRNSNFEVDGVMAGVGTGLTFIDFALAHLRRHPKNTVVGISRNGLLPEPHLVKRAAPLEVPETAKKSPEAMKSFINSADDWRAAQDGVRHELPEIWNSWSEQAKSEFFVRDLRWWNVHRHRMAPHVKQELDEAISHGRLKILKDELAAVRQAGEKLEVVLQSGGNLLTDSVINCLGYAAPDQDTLVGKLLQREIAVAAPLNLGIRTAFPNFNVLRKDTEAWRNLFALGPILLGERFETTAIPELRVQASEIAASIIDQAIV